MDVNQFRNQFMKECHPETHEMITNAERAYESGEISREERDDAIRTAIMWETEHLTNSNLISSNSGVS